MNKPEFTGEMNHLELEPVDEIPREAKLAAACAGISFQQNSFWGELTQEMENLEMAFCLLKYVHPQTKLTQREERIVEYALDNYHYLIDEME